MLKTAETKGQQCCHMTPLLYRVSARDSIQRTEARSRSSAVHGHLRRHSIADFSTKSCVTQFSTGEGHMGVNNGNGDYSTISTGLSSPSAQTPAPI